MIKTFDVIIEIPLGSRIKYEIDKKSNMVRVDRYLKTPIPYPFNYGFFPNTLAEDNDPLDAILLINESLVPGCIIECEIIGGIEMIDSGEIDHKIFVIPKKSFNFSNDNMVFNDTITNEFEKTVRYFLENYKSLENKKVTLGNVLTRNEALQLYYKTKIN